MCYISYTLLQYRGLPIQDSLFLGRVIESVGRAMRMVVPRTRVGTHVTRLNHRVARHCGSDNDSVILINLLHNSFVFVTSLYHRIRMSRRISFVATSDCNDNVSAAHSIGVLGSLSRSVHNGSILVIRSVVSSKGALSGIHRVLDLHRPGSLTVYALLSGPSHHRIGIPMRFVNFSVPSRFIINCNVSCTRHCHRLPCVNGIVLLSRWI